MIANNDQNNQMPTELKSGFNELEMLKHLRKAGITKGFGFSCAYLFQLLFCLIFEQKNWFRLLESKKSESLPGKDTIYRFLNYSKYNWRRFLLSLSASTISKVSRLTKNDRPKVLIVDDSAYERNRSKKVELLARCFDHASQKMRFYKGFRMLTLGWSDGATFMPVDFSLLSSKKSKINDISNKVDKRTSGYKRREEALQTAPEQLPSMISRALSAGIDASYVLMDSWFTQQPLIQSIVEQGIDVIGMVKATNQRYLVDEKRVNLKELYRLAKPASGNKSILHSIHTTMANGVPVKVVFVRNRNKRSEWLAILSTDCTLTETEIIRIYGMRWDIEVFFKATKSLLKLQKEFQGRSYDSLISHTTIVFSRYILLSWQNRCSTDDRTLGGMFYELCDEVNELDWAVALQQLIELLEDALNKTNKKFKKLIKSQLQYWFAGLPNYIKVYLPSLGCES
ncbi:IS4 family transposase [Bacilli bacterium]|nr:transposase [Bacilli bacterium VT-13-104]PZD81343.1 IS4 family transposase [Bacilli bacterium]KKE80169.1 transposase [Bacilli bacterium VT-13-104]PZD83015.1 IS4 family transposase [Bacilli bacterium]PZD84147.1 IS4 family transposase [Bacilli bacterium]